MFDDCQTTFVNELSGSLAVSTEDTSSCRRTRQWYFFYDYGYTLLIRFVNITQVLSSTYMLKAYSMTDGHRTLLSDISNAARIDREVLIRTEDDRSGVLVELTSVEGRQQASFTIDYIFRGKNTCRRDSYVRISFCTSAWSITDWSTFTARLFFAVVHIQRCSSIVHRADQCYPTSYRRCRDRCCYSMVPTLYR